jgi:Ca2+-binding RTX toxin-like protein
MLASGERRVAAALAAVIVAVALAGSAAVTYAAYADRYSIDVSAGAGTWGPQIPGECAHIAFAGAPILGTDGNDVITGTNGNDLVFGLGGDDIIRGANGDDCLVGGAGNDWLGAQSFFVHDHDKHGKHGTGGYEHTDYDDEPPDAGPSYYRVDASKMGGGTDHENGEDVLLGGDGRDGLNGGNGTDLLVGGAGNDFLDGRNGEDSLFGGSGWDLLVGANGTDVLDGGTVLTPPDHEIDACFGDRAKSRFVECELENGRSGL